MMRCFHWTHKHRLNVFGKSVVVLYVTNSVVKLGTVPEKSG